MAGSTLAPTETAIVQVSSTPTNTASMSAIVTPAPTGTITPISPEHTLVPTTPVVTQTPDVPLNGVEAHLEYADDDRTEISGVKNSEEA